MSGSAKHEPPGHGAAPAGGADPSMEDILASIRRILNEEDKPDGVPPPSPEAPPNEHTGDDDVLVLDPSMMIPDPAPSGSPPSSSPHSPHEPPAVPRQPEATSLVGPEAARAAAASVADLVRKLAAERATQTHAGGPTIEDLVRAELRPILKEWLETHLPGLVERLVRAEIERVVGRATP